MMVIAAMATGLVLSTAYVAASTNGAVIAANLTASSLARWRPSALVLTISARRPTMTADQPTTGRASSGEEDTSTRVVLLDLATDDLPGESTVDVRDGDLLDGASSALRRSSSSPCPSRRGRSTSTSGNAIPGESITVRSEAIVEPWSASPPMDVAIRSGGDKPR